MRGGGAVVNMPAIKRWFDLPTAAPWPTPRSSWTTQRIGTAWARLGIRVNSITAPEIVPSQRSGLSVQIEQGLGAAD